MKTPCQLPLNSKLRCKKQHDVFFDNNVAPALVNILKALSVDAVHLKEHFKQNTTDEDWIPEVGRHGWIVVTWDFRIYKRPAQRDALTQNGVKAVFLPSSFSQKKIWDQAAWIVKHWPKIVEQVDRFDRFQCVRITDNGKVELLS